MIRMISASESTFYRVLREAKMQNHRGRASEGNRHKPTSYTATAPNQVWMWDITYLRGPIKGRFYYLYLMQNHSLRHLSTVRIISPKDLKISTLPENGVSCLSNGIATSITTVALNSSRRRRCIMAKQKLS